METFLTWAQAHAYYSACFEALSVHIRDPPPMQSPTHSPARKKQKILNAVSPLPRPKALAQPHFAPALNKSALIAGPIVSGTTKLTSDTVSATATVGNSQAKGTANTLAKRLHHGFMATAQDAVDPNIHYPNALVSTSPTPSPQILVCHPCRVIVDDSSDDSMTDNRLVYPKVHALPTPTSSLIAEFSSNPPTIHNTASPIIIISDSEESLANNSDNNHNLQCFAPSSLIVDFNSDPRAIHTAPSPVIVISDSEEEEVSLFDPDTERELNRLYAIQKPGPLPRGYYRL